MTDTVTGRLNFRVSPDQERSLRRAAGLTGQSVSGFVLPTAVERAESVIARANATEVSDAAYEAFVAALDRPAEVVPELAELFARPSRIPRG